jgi:hypothetical protein
MRPEAIPFNRILSGIEIITAVPGSQGPGLRNANEGSFISR